VFLVGIAIGDVLAQANEYKPHRMT
jgi:hypothetical protein